MFGDLLEEFEKRFPWFATWFGNRLDVELPAFLLSVTMHSLLLIGLAFAGYQVHREVQREFRSEVVDNRVSSESTYQDLDQGSVPLVMEPVAGSFSPNLAPTIASVPSTAGGTPVTAASADVPGVLAPIWSNLMFVGRLRLQCRQRLCSDRRFRLTVMGPS